MADRIAGKRAQRNCHAVGGQAAVLLWVGNVLYTFAACGMLLYPCRKLPPRSLLLAGCACLTMLSGFFVADGSFDGVLDARSTGRFCAISLATDG